MLLILTLNWRQIEVRAHFGCEKEMLRGEFRESGQLIDLGPTGDQDAFMVCRCVVSVVFATWIVENTPRSRSALRKSQKGIVNEKVPKPLPGLLPDYDSDLLPCCIAADRSGAGESVSLQHSPIASGQFGF